MTGRSIFLAVLVAVLWGGNFIAVKLGTQGFPPIFLLTLRFLVVAVLVLPFVGMLPRGSFLPIFLLSLTLGVLHFGLMFSGVARIDASTAAIAGQLGVPFSTLLAVVVFRDSLGWRRILGIAVAFAGVAVLAGAPQAERDLGGLALVVSATLAWAMANIIIKHYGPFDTFMLIAWMALMAVPQLLILSLLLESGQWQSLREARWPAWLGLAYTAVGSSIVAYAVWYRLLDRNDVSQVVPFVLLVPVFAVIIGFLLLGEALTPSLVGGGVLTVGGVALCEMRFRRRPRKLKLTEEDGPD